MKYFDNIGAFLQRLLARYRLSIISNTHYPPLVLAHLEQMEIRPLFTTITLSITHGLRKPHPAIFQGTLKTLSVDGAQTLYVGDNYEADYMGARNASLNAVLIDPNDKYRLMESVPYLYDLERYLSEIGQGG